jgi:transposase
MEAHGERRLRMADQTDSAKIQPKTNRKDPICFSKHPYKALNAIERFLNRIKQFHRIATLSDNLAEDCAAALDLLAERIGIRDL